MSEQITFHDQPGCAGREPGDQGGLYLYAFLAFVRESLKKNIRPLLKSIVQLH